MCSTSIGHGEAPRLVLVRSVAKCQSQQMQQPLHSAVSFSALMIRLVAFGSTSTLPTRISSLSLTQPYAYSFRSLGRSVLDRQLDGHSHALPLAGALHDVVANLSEHTRQKPGATEESSSLRKGLVLPRHLLGRHSERADLWSQHRAWSLLTAIPEPLRICIAEKLTTLLLASVELAEENHLWQTIHPKNLLAPTDTGTPVVPSLRWGQTSAPWLRGARQRKDPALSPKQPQVPRSRDRSCAAAPSAMQLSLQDSPSPLLPRVA